MSKKERPEQSEERARRRQVWDKIRSRISDPTDDMNQEMTAGELKDLWYRRALELSRPPDQESEEQGTRKMVTFRLGTDRYAVGIEMVREIQRGAVITPLPSAPDFVAGVTNLRGNILSIIDIRLFFGLRSAGRSSGTLILVVEDAGLNVGILVDRVDEIATVLNEKIKPPLSLDKGLTEDYVTGIVSNRGEMVILVDLKKVLKNPRLIVVEHV